MGAVATPPPPATFPGRLTAGHGTLDAVIEVRILAREPCPRSPTGRGTTLRTSTVPVRIRPRVRMPAKQVGTCVVLVRRREPVRVRPLALGRARFDSGSVHSRACSSSGRAPFPHNGGKGFESPLVHQARLAQLAEASRSGRGGSGFESLAGYVGSWSRGAAGVLAALSRRRPRVQVPS